MIICIEIEETKTSNGDNIPLKWFNGLYGIGIKHFVSETKIPKIRHFSFDRHSIFDKDTIFREAMRSMGSLNGWSSGSNADTFGTSKQKEATEYDVVLEYNYVYSFLFESTKLDLHNDSHIKFWKSVMSALAKFDKRLELEFSLQELDNISSLFVKEGTASKTVTCFKKQKRPSDNWQEPNGMFNTLNVGHSETEFGRQYSKLGEMHNAAMYSKLISDAVLEDAKKFHSGSYGNISGAVAK